MSPELDAPACEGVAVVDKPAGMTSHDVVAAARRALGERRVGHAGTLDPDATGVLLLGVGRATRLLRYLSGLPKSYAAEVVLGVATTTLDASGEVTGRWDQTGVSVEQARKAALALTGEIEQVPPMVSALKVGGRRLHSLARAGLEVERLPRRVTVSRFRVEAVIDPEPPEHGGGPVLSIEVDCSSGTYVRSLAADLGAALGGGAYLRRLRRTAVGRFRVEEAVQLACLDAASLLAPAAAVAHLPSVEVDPHLERAIRSGMVLEKEVLGGEGEGPWAVLDRSGRLMAVYRASAASKAKPEVVLAAQ